MITERSKIYYREVTSKEKENEKERKKILSNMAVE